MHCTHRGPPPPESWPRPALLTSPRTRKAAEGRSSQFRHEPRPSLTDGRLWVPWRHLRSPWSQAPLPRVLRAAATWRPGGHSPTVMQLGLEGLTSGCSCPLLLGRLFPGAAAERRPRGQFCGRPAAGGCPCHASPHGGSSSRPGCAEERRADSSASRRKPHPARLLGALGLTPCTPGVSASGPLLASPKTEPSARQPGTSRPDSPVFLQPPWSEMHSVQRRQTCPSPKAVALWHCKAAFPNPAGGAGGPRTATVLAMTSSPAETQPSLHGLTALQPGGTLAVSPRRDRLVLYWAFAPAVPTAWHAPPLMPAWLRLPTPRGVCPPLPLTGCAENTP